MLMLKRTRGQKILIHTAQGTLTVVAHEWNKNQIQLGFEGPRDIRVVREEVVERDREMAVTS